MLGNRFVQFGLVAVSAAGGYATFKHISMSNKADSVVMSKVDFKEGEGFNNARRLVDYQTQVLTDQAYAVFYRYVHPDDSARDASKRLGEQIAKEVAEQNSSRDAWKYISSEEKPDSLEDQLFYDHVLTTLRRTGAHLSERDNKKCQELDKELIDLQSELLQHLI